MGSAELHPELHDETRARILSAAGEIFAEEGFQAATVRAICEKAQVNVAAINYHFGDKLALYTEVLRLSLRRERPLPDTSDPVAALRQYIKENVSRLLGSGQDAWRVHLMAKEMAQPTPALRSVVDETIRPKMEWLRNVIATITGLPPESDSVARAVFSVIAQCVSYRTCSPVLRQLWPWVEYTPDEIDRIANHIAEFSLRGIEGMKVLKNEGSSGE